MPIKIIQLQARFPRRQKHIFPMAAVRPVQLTGVAGSGGVGAFVDTSLTIEILTSGTEWTVPDNIVGPVQKIELWGAGGSGDALYGSGGFSAHGGGGGAYTYITNITYTAGSIISYSIGQGGAPTLINDSPGAAGIDGTATTFDSGAYSAAGGQGGYQAGGGGIGGAGAGGAASACIPAANAFSGGDGGEGIGGKTTNTAGGGGGAAGPNGAGVNALSVPTNAAGPGSAANNGESGAAGQAGGAVGTWAYPAPNLMPSGIPAATSPNTCVVSTAVTPPNLLATTTTVYENVCNDTTSASNCGSATLATSSVTTGHVYAGGLWLYIPSAWSGTAITVTIGGSSAVSACLTSTNQWQYVFVGGVAATSDTVEIVLDITDATSGQPVYTCGWIVQDATTYSAVNAWDGFDNVDGGGGGGATFNGGYGGSGGNPGGGGGAIVATTETSCYTGAGGDGQIRLSYLTATVSPATLTGANGSGSSGSLIPTIAIALPSLSGSGSTTAPIQDVVIALGSTTSTGEVHTVTTPLNQEITGVDAHGNTGTADIVIKKAITGTAGSGEAHAIIWEPLPTVNGIHATGEATTTEIFVENSFLGNHGSGEATAPTVVYITEVSLQGVFGSGNSNAITPEVTTSFTGIYSTAETHQLGFPVKITPLNNFAKGLAGLPALQLSSVGQFPGLHASAKVGTIFPAIPVSGVAAAGHAQTVTPSLTYTLPTCFGSGLAGALLSNLVAPIGSARASGSAETAAIKDSITLIGLAGHGSATTMTASLETTFPQNYGSGNVGDVVAQRGIAISGVAGTGIGNTVDLLEKLGLPAIYASGAAQAPSRSVIPTPLPASSGQGSANTVVITPAPILGSLAANGHVQTVTGIDVDKTFSGNAASGSLGNLLSLTQIVLSSDSATGTVHTTSTDLSFTLPTVSGQGSATTSVASILSALSGVAATTQVNTVSFNTPATLPSAQGHAIIGISQPDILTSLSGVFASTSVKTVAISGGPVLPSAGGSGQAYSPKIGKNVIEINGIYALGTVNPFSMGLVAQGISSRGVAVAPTLAAVQKKKIASLTADLRTVILPPKRSLRSTAIST